MELEFDGRKGLGTATTAYLLGSSPDEKGCKDAAGAT